MKRFKSHSVRQMYDSWAHRYDREFKNNGWCGPETLHKTLSAQFNLNAKKLRVLDVGIGTGTLSQQFRNANPRCHITGIDISEGMLESCAHKKIANVLKQQDFQKKGIPFADKSFDVAVSSGVFELLDHPEKVINEMGRVLRPSGAFAFTVYSDSPRHYPCHRHDDELIENALKKARMTPANVSRFWAFNHHDNDIYYNLYSGQKHTLAR